MTSTSKFDPAHSNAKKIAVKLDCDCGAMLVPAPFVENNTMRIAYNCPTDGTIHVVDPFS
jgi:hypothetical protein